MKIWDVEAAKSKCNGGNKAYFRVHSLADDDGVASSCVWGIGLFQGAGLGVSSPLSFNALL
jgi:hypothetical protein